MSIICEFCDTRIKNNGNLNEEKNKHIKVCEIQLEILRKGECICSEKERLPKENKGLLIMHLKTHFKEEPTKNSSPNTHSDYFSDKSNDDNENIDYSENENEDDGIPDFDEDAIKETSGISDTPNGMFYIRVPSRFSKFCKSKYH